MNESMIGDGPCFLGFVSARPGGWSMASTCRFSTARSPADGRKHLRAFQIRRNGPGRLSQLVTMAGKRSCPPGRRGSGGVKEPLQHLHDEGKRPKIVYAEIGINEFMPSSGLCRVSPRNIAKSQNLSVEARHNPESLSTA
jgi:hypothetical protein